MARTDVRGYDRSLLLRKLDASDKLVDFARLTVEPLDNPTVQKLAEDLADTFSIAWDAELSAELFHLIGAPVPYFIHIFFAQAGQLPLTRRARLTTATLAQIYQDRVLGPTCRHYFNHYSSRLKRYGKMGEKGFPAVFGGMKVGERRHVSRRDSGT